MKQEKTCIPQPSIVELNKFMQNNKNKNMYMYIKRGVNVHVSVHKEKESEVYEDKKEVRCMWVKINMTLCCDLISCL